MENAETLIFNAAYLGYTLSMICYLTYAFNKKESIGKLAFNLVLFSSLLHLTNLVLRAYVFF